MRRRVAAVPRLAVPVVVAGLVALASALHAPDLRADTAGATAGEPRGTGVTAALGDEARVSGEGRFTFLGLKVYDARLWIGRGFDARRLTDGAFALELTYLRRFEGRAIAERSLSEIEKLGIGNAAQRAAWLADLQRLLPDVSPGDRLTGVWRPGQGTTFLRNDRPVGRVDDPSFAHAFFSIWLDPRTPAPSLRRALLAGAPGADAGDAGGEGAPRAAR